MFKAEVNVFALVAAVLAATVARYSPDAGWVMAAAGLLLSLTLWTFDRRDVREMWQSVAYAGVLAYCLVIGVLGVLALARIFWPQGVPWPLPFWSQPAAWAILLVALTILDQVRMESRRPQGLFASPAPTATPVEATLEPKPSPVQAGLPVPPAGKPVAVKPVELPANAGRPATIYLNVLDAGIACLRAVQAEHLGRDYYRIVEAMPTEEKWEFGQGQVVRCQKRKLSSGKALVATEEAPRANPA